MPRAIAANKQLREAQRENILEAAKKVFAARGMAATMDDIATEAEVSHGLAYRYFANKEAIFYALIEQAMKEATPLTRICEMPGTPGERLSTMITRMIEGRRQPEFHQLMSHMLSAKGAPTELCKLVYQRSQELQGALRQLIIEAQASGEVAADDPDQLVLAIFAYIEGLARWGGYNPEHYRQHFPDAKIFLRMFRP